MKLLAITLITILLSGFVSAQTTDSTAAAPQRGNGNNRGWIALSIWMETVFAIIAHKALDFGEKEILQT